jgi:hypothetical protein
VRKLAIVAVVGVLAFSGVVAAQTNDEPVDFTLDCTVTGRIVECSGTLPEEEPPSTSAPITIPPTSAATTTAPSTSSSVATSSTTSPPSSTQSSTPTTSSTQPATSSTQPPTGDGFVASFATPSDFYDRFDTYTGNYCTGNYPPTCRPENIGGTVTNFSGDHNMNCEGPTTQRNVSITNHANLFWWCAPGGGPDTGHVMIGNSLTGYAISGFTPKRFFTDIRSVCWDQNLTDLGGGKWMVLTIVPKAELESHPNLNPRRVEELEGPWRLDYTLPEFDAEGQTGDFSLQRETRWQFKLFRNTLRIFDRVNGAGDWGTDNGFIAGHDVATRYRICLTENSQGRVVVTQQNPNGTSTWTTATRFPDGEVYVIWADDTYDDPKREGDLHKTWHLDNVAIS